MPRKKKTTTAAAASPEKATTTRRTTRKGKDSDEIPLHLLKASDESSENSGDDSDYGSPKKGRGRGGKTVGTTRGRKPKNPPAEPSPVLARPRRGRRAAKEPTPDVEQHVEDDYEQDHSQSTQEMSESTQEHAFEQVQSHDEYANNEGKVSEVSIDQDLQAYNDQGPVDQEVEQNIENNDNEVVGTCDDDVAMINDDDDEPVRLIEDNPITIDESSEESKEKSVEPEQPPQLQQQQQEIVEIRDETPESNHHQEVVSEPIPEVKEEEKPTRKKSQDLYGYPHKDTPLRSRSSSGEIHDEASASKAAVEVAKKVEEKAATPATTRKRKWGARKPDDDPVIAITSDSLKTIISEEVKPVPLSDVRLFSTSPEHEPEEKRQRVKLSAEDKDAKKKLLKERLRMQEEEEEQRNQELIKAMEKQKAATMPAIEVRVFQDRKISIVNDEPAAAPSPAKNESSNILYITNLVRPFTVIQLRALLARTGKIVENGFWIDKIKSKCYVKYENEEEAIETRHALHGVTWPTSNPKSLNVDFGLEADMEKAILSTLEEMPRITITTENRDVKKEKDFGWSKDPNKITREEDRSKSMRHVREWDVGKKENDEKREVDRPPRERERERERERDRNVDRERDRGRDRRSPERQANRRDRENDIKKDDRVVKSRSKSPERKDNNDEEEQQIPEDPNLKHTKAQPSVSWRERTPGREPLRNREKFNRPFYRNDNNWNRNRGGWNRGRQGGNFRSRSRSRSPRRNDRNRGWGDRRDKNQDRDRRDRDRNNDRSGGYRR